MSGSVRKRLDSAHTYDALVMLAVTNESPEIREHLSQIDKDLLRTFPGALCCCLPPCLLPKLTIAMSQRTHSSAKAGRQFWDCMRGMMATTGLCWSRFGEFCRRTACAILALDIARQ